MILVQFVRCWKQLNLLLSLRKGSVGRCTMYNNDVIGLQVWFWQTDA